MKQSNGAENWANIFGFEDYYSVSSMGRVHSKIRNRILKGCSGKYVQYILCKDGVKKTVYGHRLVAQHFIENPRGLPEVNHFDGDRKNNCATNLEWVSASDNQKHSFAMGLSSGPPFMSTITEEIVFDIRKRLAGGESGNSVARFYGINSGTVSRIRTGKRWSYLV